MSQVPEVISIPEISTRPQTDNRIDNRNHDSLEENKWRDKDDFSFVVRVESDAGD